jgi:hypothetical protein
MFTQINYHGPFYVSDCQLTGQAYGSTHRFVPAFTTAMVHVTCAKEDFPTVLRRPVSRWKSGTPQEKYAERQNGQAQYHYVQENRPNTRTKLF